MSLMSPALAGGFFILVTPGKPTNDIASCQNASPRAVLERGAMGIGLCLFSGLPALSHSPRRKGPSEASKVPFFELCKSLCGVLTLRLSGEETWDLHTCVLFFLRNPLSKASRQPCMCPHAVWTQFSSVT